MEALYIVGETVTGAHAVVQVVKFWDYHMTYFPGGVFNGISVFHALDYKFRSIVDG